MSRVAGILAEMKIERLGNERRCLTLFTKPARPGEVKTRLIGELAPEQAAELHAAFRDDLLERLAPGGFELRIAWALSDGEPLPDGSAAGLRQVGADLGERLFHALSRSAESFELVAAVGSDHPLLTAAAVEEGFERLERGAEVVLGPASDGGYYLVATRASSLDRRLFADVPWSTSRVLSLTLDRCRELAVAVELLDEASDVDTPEDLRALGRALTEPGAPACPRTRRLLDGWGRLPAERQARRA